MLKYIISTVLLGALTIAFMPNPKAAAIISGHDYCNFNPEQWPPKFIDPEDCNQELLSTQLCLGSCYQQFLDEIEFLYEECCDAQTEAQTQFQTCMASADGPTQQQQCREAYEEALAAIESTMFAPGEAAASDNYDACIAWCCEE